MLLEIVNYIVRINCMVRHLENTSSNEKVS